jgi:uncharacterized protein
MNKNLQRSDRLLKKQILSLNRHIPKERKTLADLLTEEKPHVHGADGARHRFHKKELDKLAKIIPKSEYKKLKIPIYIEIDSDSSGARITGNLECKILKKLLDVKCETNEIFIYRPYIRILRNELPTTTQYIFLVR